MNQSKYNNKISSKGLFIWFIAVIFYFYECFLRVFPNTLSSNLIDSFQMNAEHFSILGSSFFVSYALMQIPVGMLIHKFGIRRILIIAVFICAISVLVFSFSYNLKLAIAARFFMGVGASFGFISLLSLALNWFPARHFGFFSGFSQFLGSIGPFLAGAPLAYVVQETGSWRNIFFYLSLFGFILVFLIFLFIQNKPKSKHSIVFLEFPKNISNCFKFLKKKQIIFIIAYTAIIYVSMPIIGSFWGSLYLQSRGFLKPQAALLSSLIWIGYCVTAPLIGKISDKKRRRNPSLIFTSLLGIIGSSCLLFVPTNNQYFIATALILIGVAGAGQALSFVVISENVNKHFKTTMLGINNMFLMMLAATVPLIIGAIIHSDGSGQSTYSQVDFEKGLIIMPFSFLICFFLSAFFIKETFCRSKYELEHLRVKKN